MLKKIKYLLLCSILPFSVYGKPPSVNILTWWGYLDYPWEQTDIEKHCHVTISYDEYYSNSEFTRRWSTSPGRYDIIIFEDTMYPAIQDSIPTLETNLYFNSNKYQDIIKNKYIERQYPHNIVFFFQSIAGFLWNPKVIHLDKTDSVSQIFSKASNNYVVILDDPIIYKTLQENSEIKDDQLSLNSFLDLMQNTKFIINNDYSNVYTGEKFAFAYTWSGVAILYLNKSNVNLKFLMQPKLSYISSDLLAQVSNKPGVYCVAKYMSSKAFLNKLQNDTYYFSPYVDDSKVTNISYKNLYQNYIKYLPEMQWVKPLPWSDFEQLTETWKMIKLNVEQ